MVYRFIDKNLQMVLLHVQEKKHLVTRDKLGIMQIQQSARELNKPTFRKFKKTYAHLSKAISRFL